MEFSKTECKRILRTLELKAYRSVVDALRAQGALTASKHEVLKNLAVALKVGEERYLSEMRRAANDDVLNTIAQNINGKNTEKEWRTESMKKVPLTPMVASHTAFTVLADVISDIVSLENEKFLNSGELSNLLESYKFKNDINLEKYQSSKILDSLLKKRKNHHQNLILSELENIKLNNNHHSSPTKSGYIEISYDEKSSTAETQSVNCSVDDTNSSYDTLMSSSFEKFNSLERNFSSRNFENKKISSDTLTRKKSRLKFKRGEKKNNGSNLLNVSKIPNSGRARNLRAKSLRKYTWNSVEIKAVEDVEKARLSKITDKKPVNVCRNSEKQNGSSSSKETHVEISYSASCHNKSLNNRKSKQRNSNRSQFVRQSKISRGRKLPPSSKLKTDAAQEVVSRSARFSSRNARRRNYARIASGDYDLLEFEKIRKEKKVDDEHIEEKLDEIDESDDDTLSDSSAAPIEISYGTLSAPKSSDYDLDGVSSAYTETDDDMKPHTFNLIPASRRLKMLKKRSISPSGEEPRGKVIMLSSQSTDELSVTPSAKTSLLDVNALKKVLAAHESTGNVTSSSMSDASDIADVKETMDISDRLPSTGNSMEVKETISPFLIPPRSVPEKKVTKSKMKLSEASTIENLHSLLSKVKEGDLKKFIREYDNKKKIVPKRKKDRKTILQSASPKSSNCNETLIEVGSDGGSLNSGNCEISSKDKDIDDQTPVENRDETNENSKPSDEESKSENVSINEDEIVSVSLEDLEQPTETDVTEQLIDIESADIIIGDNVEQNDEFIFTSDDTTALKSNMDRKHVSVTTENVEASPSPTTTVQTDKIVEEKKDAIIENSANDESIFLSQNDSKLSEKIDKNTEIKKSIPVDFRPITKKVLPASADFRYMADSDKVFLKKSVSKPPSSHLLSTSVPSATTTATIINSNKKFGKQPIDNSTPVIISNTKTLNNDSKLLQNDSKNRQFVLLKTSSVTGSKSLLKPFKIFPKAVIPNQITLNSNSIVTQPKTVTLLTSLNNVKLSSVGSNSVKDAVVSISGAVAKNSDHRSNETVVSKPANEINSKRLVLSQALESSLKSIEITKNLFQNSSSVNATENPLILKTSGKMIEISSNKSSEGNPISKYDNSESITSTVVPNDANTLFTNNLMLREDKSENVSSTTKLNEMPTFFSKNIIRKQS